MNVLNVEVIRMGPSAYRSLRPGIGVVNEESDVKVKSKTNREASSQKI